MQASGTYVRLNVDPKLNWKGPIMEGWHRPLTASMVNHLFFYHKCTNTSHITYTVSKTRVYNHTMVKSEVP